MLGARLSKSQFKRVRLTQAFKPPEESKPRSHTSAMELIHHDVDKLVAKVESMPDQGLNRSALACKYRVMLTSRTKKWRTGSEGIFKARG